MTQTTELPTKRLNREPLPKRSNVFCPKCQNLLNVPRYKRTNHGTQFVYSCPECSAEFAFVPVTEFRLFEVILQ